MVPALGPNAIAAVNVNTSEIEKLAGTAEASTPPVPLSSVNAARIHQPRMVARPCCRRFAALSTAHPAATNCRHIRARRRDGGSCETVADWPGDAVSRNEPSAAP
jgi:hypothetical protein